MLRMLGVVLAVGAGERRFAPALRYTSPWKSSGESDGPVSRQVRISFSVGRAFAFEVAAGEHARRRGFFAVVNGQGEKKSWPSLALVAATAAR